MLRRNLKDPFHLSLHLNLWWRKLYQSNKLLWMGFIRRKRSSKYYIKDFLSSFRSGYMERFHALPKIWGWNGFTWFWSQERRMNLINGLAKKQDTCAECMTFLFVSFHILKFIIPSSFFINFFKIFLILFKFFFAVRVNWIKKSQFNYLIVCCLKQHFLQELLMFFCIL